MKKNHEETPREHLQAIQSQGGKARWARLTPEERSEVARKAVLARWAKRKASDAPPALDEESNIESSGSSRTYPSAI